VEVVGGKGVVRFEEGRFRQSGLGRRRPSERNGLQYS
jgi:hypothetical protein